MGPLGCLLSFVLGILFFAVALVLIGLQKIASLFGINIPWTKWFNIRVEQPFNQNTQKTTTESTTKVGANSPKYADDEGEYVEFEEIKD